MPLGSRVSASESRISPADLGVEGIPIEGHQRDTPLADSLEFRFDLAHRSPAIAVHDAEVQAVFGQLVGGGQSKAAGTAEDQGPFIGAEACR